MKNITLIILLSLIATSNIFAQNTLTGRIIDSKQQTCPYAAVQIQSADSSDNRQVAVADSLGNFRFLDVAVGNYKLYADYVGHTPTERSFTMPQSTLNIGDIILQESDNELDAIEIKSRRIVDEGSKKIIYPSDLLKQNANNGYSALALMLIPGVNVDVFENTVSTRSGSPQLCINGRPVQPDDIKTLNPADIKRIDYYTTFNAKYMSMATIDFIMENRDKGATVYLSAEENLNKFAGNDLADVKIYHNKSEFNIQVSDKYNHFTPERGTESFIEMINGNDIITKRSELKTAPTHENSLMSKLSYLYYSDNDIFDITAYVSGGHSSTGMNLEEQFSSQPDKIESLDKTHNDNISPMGQIHYEHYFQNKSFIKAMCYGSYNKTDGERKYLSNANYLSDIKEDYYYINPMMMYANPINEKNYLFAAAVYYMSTSKQTYEENTVKTTSELGLNAGNFMIGNAFFFNQNTSMTLQLSDEYVEIDNSENKTSKHNITPELYFSYWKENFGINYEFAYGTTTPDAQYFSRSYQSIDQYQVMRGNPDLGRGRKLRTVLILNYGPLNWYNEYEHRTKNIFESVAYSLPYNSFIHTYLNGDASDVFKTNLSFTLPLIENQLQFQTDFNYNYFGEKDWEKITVNAFVFQAKMLYMSNSFNAKLEFQTPYKYLNMGTKIKDPAWLKLSLGYNVKRWNFMLVVKNPMMKYAKTTEYCSPVFLSTSDVYSPYEAYNYIKLGISYRFSIGQQHEYRKIEMNEETKSGILKRN